MNEHKVIPLAAKKKAVNTPLPAQVGQLHKLLQRFLHARLSQLFVAADSYFCQMSDQAINNEEREQYFDIAQHLRKQRNAIAGCQFQAMRDQFQRLSLPGTGDERESVRGIDLDSISLLSEEQQEVEVAVRTMVNKLRHSDCQLDFEHLTTRIAALFSHGDVNAIRNPFGAESLCGSFITACESLEMPIRPRLMLFRLYEKHVLQALGGLYEEANEQLKAQGVLPGLEKAKRKAAAKSTAVPRPKAKADEQACGAAAQVNPGALKSSLQMLLRSSNSATAQPVDQGSQALVELVTSVQAAQSKGWLQENIGTGSEADQLSGLLNSVETLAQEEQGIELTAMERDVFKLVGMLFNYMCADQQLPTHFKPLFNQLQLPILKAALVDRGFFTHSEHPARLLLELLAKVGVGLDAKPQQDRLYKLLEEQISCLVHDLSPNSERFEQVVAKVNRFAALEERRANLLEQRLKAAEEGLAKTESARQASEKVLSERLARCAAPSLVESLLRGGWQQYLLLCQLKHGAESTEWRRGVKIVDQLLWSLQPKTTVAECKKLLKAIPELRRGLRAGLEAISYDRKATLHFLADLAPLHQKVVREGMERIQLEDVSEPEPTGVAVEKVGKRAPLAELAANQGKPSVNSPVISTVQQVDETNSVPPQQPVTPPAKPVSSETGKAPDAQATVAGLKAELKRKTQAELATNNKIEPQVEQKTNRAAAETVTPVEPHQPQKTVPVAERAATLAKRASADLVSAQPSVWAERVDHLQPGVWVEFKADGGEFRAKLAAYLRPTDRFIFVNRNGAKVAEPTRQELVAQLDAGDVVLLEESHLFDRALESIISSLR